MYRPEVDIEPVEALCRDYTETNSLGESGLRLSESRVWASFAILTIASMLNNTHSHTLTTFLW